MCFKEKTLEQHLRYLYLYLYIFLFRPISPVKDLLTDPQISVEVKKTGALAILDPANFTLDGGAQPPRHRVTKESFKNKNTPQIGLVNDPSDPLSALDPLWSLAK